MRGRALRTRRPIRPHGTRIGEAPCLPYSIRRANCVKGQWSHWLIESRIRWLPWPPDPMEGAGGNRGHCGPSRWHLKDIEGLETYGATIIACFACFGATVQ